MKISQRVALRDKVRQRKIRNSLQAAFKTVKICAAVFLMAFATLRIYDFLFRDDFFLIKSVMLNDQNDLSARIAADLKPLLGRSILFISTRKAESDILERYPEIASISLRLALPDRIRVALALRKPEALLRTPKNFQGIDRGGKTFPLPKSFSRFQEPLPELVMKGASSPEEPLKFLESWKKAVQNLEAPESWRLSKITVDEYGELSAEFSAGAAHASPITLAWGRAEPEHFDEKFKRLMQVRRNLTEREIQAKRVDLAGVPGKAGAAIDGGTAAGRVLVSLKKGND